MFIFILNGKDDGKRIDLSPGKYIVGRAPGSGIVLEGDGFVSGSHAELDFTAEQKLFIKDLGSKNGTYLFGELVKSPSEVNAGDIIQIGKTFLKYSRRSKERYFSDDSMRETKTEAIMVVDIVGSAKIAQAMGDSVASKVKNILKNSLKKNLVKYPAEYLKSTGDGFMIIFSKALSAVMVAGEIMKEIKTGMDFKGIHIRIGINYGETTVLEDSDRRGLAVDMAFRIESLKFSDMHETVIGIKKEDLPRMDRIFISEAVQKFIAVNSSITNRCIGFFELKGFNGRHKIFEIIV